MLQTKGAYSVGVQKIRRAKEIKKKKKKKKKKQQQKRILQGRSQKSQLAR
jgi:hypothetical protein